MNELLSFLLFSTLTFLLYFALLLFIAVESAAILLGLGLTLGDLLERPIGATRARFRW